MDLDMHQHPSATINVDKLASFGNIMIAAESDELASGLSGEGRMAEPENIVQFIENQLLKTAPLYGKNVLVSAGPTYEKIDSVRFIGNFSAGKMGIEIAKSAADLGANVKLVCGPSNISTDGVGLERINVLSALEMKKAMEDNYVNADIVIMSAAVADYRPATMAEQKIKKNDDDMRIDLVKNPDILQGLGQMKQNQILVGFEIETQNEIEKDRKSTR